MSIAISAIVVACSLPLISYFHRDNLLNSVELYSFDWRMKLAARFHPPAATNLAAVYIDEESNRFLNEDLFHVNWPYPRHIHGRIIRELGIEGARAVAFDTLVTELRRDDAPVVNPDNTVEESDRFMVRQMETYGNVIIGAGTEAYPAEIFAEAATVASISADADFDGVIRRIKPFRDDPVHGRLWHMGLVLAAREANINLDNAEILDDRILLSNANGTALTIPLDRDGMLLIDWNLAWNDPRVLKLSYGAVVAMDTLRQSDGEPAVTEYLEAVKEAGNPDLPVSNPFAGRLVVIGSVLEGNNVTDMGATPISKYTYLVSKHLNVANTILTQRFITQPGLWFEILLVLLLGMLTSLTTWKTKALHGAIWVLAATGLVVGASVYLFISLRIWIPLVTPVVGGLMLHYISLVTYRAIFEEREQRRIKQVFKRIVSPKVVNELLAAENFTLGGARRHITVFFADIRGFTEMTDSNQARAEKHVLENHLTGREADAYFDANASEVLATVNEYLSTIANEIMKQDGVLDKYIGDCVMAFWGAPIPNDRHAVDCVRAAIEAQRAIYRLNLKRHEENNRRKEANVTEMLPLLTLGTGINSGVATVGLMGSLENIFNYTVFGREVNLASRLEGLSGRSRIIISMATYEELKKHAPELAATCVEQPAATLKGFREAIVTYEVPWKTEAAESPPAKIK